MHLRSHAKAALEYAHKQKNAAYTIGKRLGGAVVAKIGQSAVNYASKRGIAALGFDQSGWNKPKGRKKKVMKSKKAKAKAHARKKIVNIVKKTIAGETPYGAWDFISSASSRVSGNAQLTMFQDSQSNVLGLNTAGEMQDLAAVMFNGKAASANGRIVAAGNFPIDVPIVVSSAFAEFRCVNNNPFSIECDFWEFDANDTQANDAVTIWFNGYNDINYKFNGSGGYTAGNNNDYYAHPSEVPLFKSFFSTKKLSFSLMPGQEKKFFIKGRSGTFLPAKYGTPASTVAVPVINTTIKGWTKYFCVNVRSQIVSGGALGVNSQHAGDPSVPTVAAFVVEMRTHYRIQAPEGTAIANRVDTLVHNNWSPTPSAAQVYNVNNPIVGVAVS
nr:MAG: capsid protein [Cressdnaviricota sp.]